MDTRGQAAQPPARPTRLMTMAALAVAELLLVILAYQVMASIECRQTEIEVACRALRSMTARGLAVMTVMALYFWLRPTGYRALAERAIAHPGHHIWMLVHLVGLAFIFLPLVLFGAAEISRAFTPTLILLTTGGLLTATGAIFWVTPLGVWRNWMRNDSYLLPLALLTGFLVPDFADLMRPLWEWSTLSSLTFFLVFLVLTLTGFDVGVHPPTYEIGVEGFWVQIASQCSGVEGIALITIFMGFYAILMRPELRQKRFWLILFPLAVLASWLFNILRITILIVIGARVSPEHALNGFHSYAGWLMFTALALLIVLIAHRAQWLHRNPLPNHPTAAIRHDTLAAKIVPFIVMMLSGVFVSAFWPDPEAGYPVRAALMALPLLIFLPALRDLWQRPSFEAALVGLVIGGIWIVTAPEQKLPEAEAPTLFWIATRLLGTILLVPIIEELFFRGYLLRRLHRDSLIWAVVAVAVSSLLFGLMHDRFLAGTLAGVAFGLLYLRRSETSDAITAHIVANATIALAALLTAKWALI
ncbi:exosortase E/protease, VPEID-CTERM system [uncultured Shimia sp.]|uniref:exosortase E/protease, VPEID-CTERM system n=1 Tax=uncultured Shimia sp. TaxID=573152 RepID=UPI0025DA164F|nr:exosortase E/protease, VPEID-CTERM system [uncultured Shimia sp.]